MQRELMDSRKHGYFPRSYLDVLDRTDKVLPSQEIFVSAASMPANVPVVDSWMISISDATGNESWHPNRFRIQEGSGLAALARLIGKNSWSPIIWDKGRRLSENFLRADFAVLDFDSPEYSIAQCTNDFADTQHVLGPTKSHRILKNGLICDRFRLIIPFSRSVYTLSEYRYNLERLVDRYNADPSCVDGGRYFRPCSSILQIVEDAEFQQEVLAPPEGYLDGVQRQLDHRQQWDFRRDEAGGIPPPWVLNFLQHGVPRGGRNETTFKVAMTLTGIGWSPEEVLTAVEGAPLSMEDFSANERRQAAVNGIRYASKARSLGGARGTHAYAAGRTRCS